MKTKKLMILCGMLTLFAFSFISCNDDDNNNLAYFIDEPVIAKFTGGTVLLDTQYGQLNAPELNGKVNNGDYLILWNFVIDEDVKPYTATGIQWKKIGADTVSIVQGDMIDNYTDSIFDVKLFLLNQSMDQFICVDSTFFVAVGQKVNSFDSYQYELLANKDSVDNKGIQSLYLRAKKLTSDDPYSYRDIPYGLNLSTLLLQNSDPTKKTITFNLKYKSGIDANGKDVYKNYRNNPVTLTYTK